MALEQELPFPPFVKTNRGNDWALSDGGKQWIIDRIDQYQSIQGQRGVSASESQNRQKLKRGEWKKMLCDAYIGQWPDFDWHQVVGPDGSDESIEKAQKVCFC